MSLRLFPKKNKYTKRALANLPSCEYLRSWQQPMAEMRLRLIPCPHMHTERYFKAPVRRFSLSTGPVTTKKVKKVSDVKQLTNSGYSQQVRRYKGGYGKTHVSLCFIQLTLSPLLLCGYNSSRKKENVEESVPSDLSSCKALGS